MEGRWEERGGRNEAGEGRKEETVRLPFHKNWPVYPQEKYSVRSRIFIPASTLSARRKGTSKADLMPRRSTRAPFYKDTRIMISE